MSRRTGRSDATHSCHARSTVRAWHAGSGDRRQHLEPDRQRKRRRQPARAARPASLDAGQQEQETQQQHHLGVVVIDGAGAEINQGGTESAASISRRSEPCADECHRPSSGDGGSQQQRRAEQQRRPQHNVTIRAMAAQQRSQQQNESGSGASTTRDQCMARPGGSSRCWIRSNQPCPAIRSRTSTSRMARR